MCSPVAAAGLAIVSTAVGIAGQDRSAKQAQKEAVDSLNGEYATIGDQQRQIGAQASDESTERAKQALRDQGQLTAAFADSGLSGNSQQRLMVEQSIQANADQATIVRNRDNKIEQTKVDAQAARARAVAAVRQNPRQSALGMGLQIASAGANAYGSSGGFSKGK